MLTVEEALESILAVTPRLGRERTPLLEAAGRVLAVGASADIDLPSFDNAAVDGYAVRSADTAGASRTAPITLRTLRDVPAGRTAEQAVESGTAARVMTGAPVPRRADAMVMVEDTASRTDGSVDIHAEAVPAQHIRRQGSEMRRGDRALEAGTLLRPAEIGLLAALGLLSVPVCERPHVAILTTGDEVVMVEEGAEPPPGHIRNSNRFMLAALARDAGAVLHRQIHVPDDLELTVSALRELTEEAAGPHVIVAAGGVSVGDRDFVKPALERLGELSLWRVAMKPGKPLAFGRIGKTLFFGLPGNPVSALVTFELFVRPALWKMAGRTVLERQRFEAVLTHPVAHVPGRREYVRVVARTESGRLVATPTDARLGSGALTSVTAANAFLIVPTEAEQIEAGSLVDVIFI